MGFEGRKISYRLPQKFLSAIQPNLRISMAQRSVDFSISSAGCVGCLP